MRAFLTARHPRFALQEIRSRDRRRRGNRNRSRWRSSRQRSSRAVSPMATPASPSAHAKVAVQPRRPKPIAVFVLRNRCRRPVPHEPPIWRSLSYRRAGHPTGQPYLVFVAESRMAQGIARAIARRGHAAGRCHPRPGHGRALWRGGRGRRPSIHPTHGRQNGYGIGQQLAWIHRVGRLVSAWGCPDAGTLSATGPSDEYVYKPLTDDARPLVTRTFSHASEAIAFKPGVESIEVNLTLRPGITVKGKVAASDGQPVAGAWILSRVIMEPSPGSTSWQGSYHHTTSRDGHFEIRGLDVDDAYPVYFLHPERNFGAMAVISSKSAAIGPLTIRLEPCGSARAHIVDPAGKPIEGPLRRRCRPRCR